VPGILGRCLDGLHVGSGWSYLVVMGGPHPLSNGEIAVARFDVPLYSYTSTDIPPATVPGQKAMISAKLILTSRSNTSLISQNIWNRSTVSLNLALYYLLNQRLIPIWQPRPHVLSAFLLIPLKPTIRMICHPTTLPQPLTRKPLKLLKN